jgi:hypothetical protein
MWNVYVMSKEVSSRPSDLLGIRDDYSAWCLDEVVIEWGMYVNSELDKIKDKRPKAAEGKRKARLKQLLEPGETVQKYATPTATR